MRPADYGGPRRMDSVLLPFWYASTMAHGWPKTGAQGRQGGSRTDGRPGSGWAAGRWKDPSGAGVAEGSAISWVGNSLGGWDGERGSYSIRRFCPATAD